MRNYYIIDFDSTFVKVEALDELARISLVGNPKKDEVSQKIGGITKQGMEGKISFNESLAKRLQLFQPNQLHIKKLIRFLKKNITSSILKNKDFFKQYRDSVYIISGGFKEYILPVVKEFGVSESHILCNQFQFDKKGNVVGYDTNNFLAQKNGKAKSIKNLNLEGKVIVLGDGYTDYEIKKLGVADHFIAFVENVHRKDVIKHADYVVTNFDEFLFNLNLPRSLSYPKSKMKVLLLENIDESAVTVFKKEGYMVERLPAALSEDRLSQKIQDVSILGIRSKTEITKSILQKAQKLLAIGAFCIGTNQIDLASSSQKGIAVFNAPYSNTRSVVELVIGEIIMLYRRVFDKSNILHQGIWDKSSDGSHEIRGKTLGIIGYGSIGSQLSVLAEAFGMNVCFYDIAEKLALGNARRCDSLAELLKISDVVTVHVNGRSENTNLIGEREFQLMKEGALFLNLSRGFVVDLESLSRHIKNGKIKGAAIDVFQNEPNSNIDSFSSPLQKLPNVIMTPHIGGSTVEAQKNIGEFVAKRLIHFVNTGDTTLSINFPNLQLPEMRQVHRFIHIHNNVPGILAKLNSILAQNKINIEGQYLKTNEELGYVITDVNREYSNDVIEKLRSIPDTIKFRVLY